jgi:hypothetical protein
MLMAIYHLHCKVFSRSKGQTAIAAAAYRSGTKLEDHELGTVSDYTKKKGIAFSEIELPSNAPKEYADREVLWNAVQEVEKSKDAQLCREFEIALPKELSLVEQIELVRTFAKSLVSEGMIADYSIHDKNDGNPHVHILTTMRGIDDKGKWMSKQKKIYSLDEGGNRIPIIDKKTGQQKISNGRRQWKRETLLDTSWNSKEQLLAWRKRWSDICNEAIDKKNALIEEENLAVNLYAQQPEINHIDHRSYAEQGVNKTPTIHEGWQARKMERLGMTSERLEQNRRINQMNSIWSQLNDVSKKYRKYNEDHYQDYQKEVKNHERRIRNFRSSSGRSSGVTGHSGANYQNDVYSFAGNTQTEPASYREITAMSRRGKSSEGTDSAGLADQTSLSDIIRISDLIDDANSSMESEAETLIEAIINALFSGNKKKKKHELQLVR